MEAWQSEIAKAIQEDFRRRKSKNVRYSVRQYAKKAGLSVGAMSELLRGKRKLTRERSLALLRVLQLDPSENLRLHLLLGHHPTPADGTSVVENLASVIDDFRKLFLMLKSSGPFEPDAWAKQLQIDPTEVDREIEELRERDLWPVSNLQLNWGIAQLAAHRDRTRETLGLRKKQAAFALEVAECDSPDDVEFDTLFLCLSGDQVRELTRALRAHVLRASLTTEVVDDSKLFQILIQAFPLET